MKIRLLGIIVAVGIFFGLQMIIPFTYGLIFGIGTAIVVIYYVFRKTYTDDERYQLASKKVGLGGLGINPEFDLGVIISGITIGVGSAIGLTLYWRKRK